jgi:hypothetical protein
MKNLTSCGLLGMLGGILQHLKQAARFATPKDATLRGVRREHLTPKPLVCLLIPSGNMAHLFMDSFSIAETNRG